MKLYKLIVTGNNSEYNIEYNFSNNFVSYNKFDFTGSEQEKYDKFLADLKPNAGAQPINIKVKMTTQVIDRAIVFLRILKKDFSKKKSTEYYGIS